MDEKERFWEQVKLSLAAILGGLFFVVITLIFVLPSLFNSSSPMADVFTTHIGDTTIDPITTVLFLIVVFFVFREIFTWYWKINKIVHLLKKIEENTRPNSPS